MQRLQQRTGRGVGVAHAQVQRRLARFDHVAVLRCQHGFADADSVLVFAKKGALRAAAVLRSARTRLDFATLGFGQIRQKIMIR